MEICIIAAVAADGAIGRGNQLLWHLPEDLKNFKATTMGCPIIMGRRTFESLGMPLPGRKNIVVSSRHPAPEGCAAEFCASVEDGIALAQSSGPGSEEVFVIGGGQLYRQAMPLADRLYITEVEAVIDDAEVFFPQIDPAVWKEMTRSELRHDDRSGYDYSFVTSVRR